MFLFQQERNPYKCRNLLQWVTSIWFSELLLGLFLKFTQPKIILMPKTHILGDKFCSPTTPRLQICTCIALNTVHNFNMMVSIHVMP